MYMCVCVCVCVCSGGGLPLPKKVTKFTLPNFFCPSPALATATHNLVPTLIKHLIQLIKVFRITRNFQAGVI